MPVTNHIARDFQLTLCSALGAPVAKDAYPWVRGDREARRDSWPEEQGLAACEQGPQQVVFTVAKFRPLDPISSGRSCPSCSASWPAWLCLSLGSASCAY